MTAYKSIMLTGEVHLSKSRNQSHANAFRSLCEEAKRIGVTHVQVNSLADPYHPILLEQPGNHYAWFAGYGASLDQFVASRLNRDLYLQAYLSRNLQHLIENARAALAVGLKPVLMLCEPRFLPERFFQKHPGLRGPRVDNPNLSTTPLYALCTDLPEVRAHYQEMLSSLLRHVPELAGISVFTNDSGAGFCHSKSLYAGPNGPRFCGRSNVGQRIATFLACLQETGVAINPEFQVSLATGVEGQERSDFLAAAPGSVTGEVQGKWSWLGGLEDQWAAHQYRSRIGQVGHGQARKERIAEFEQRVAGVRQRNKRVVAICSMPSEGFYPPIQYVPHPFQNLEILSLLHQMGVEHLNCKGNLTVAPFVRHDINREAFAAFQQSPGTALEKLIRQIAVRWAGDCHADGLTEAWQLVDLAQRHRPLWTHMFGYSLHFLPGPLVPNVKALSADEIAYYDHQAVRDFESIPGRDRFDSLRIDETERAWMIETYCTETLPALQKALDTLLREIGRADNDQFKACLAEQADHVHHFLLWQKCSRNWCEAGAHLRPGTGTPSPRRKLAEIITDEIANREAMIALLQGRLENFLWVGFVEGLLYEKWPNFVEQLGRSVEVMRRHQHDEVK